MATIASLVVQIGADTAELRRNMEQATTHLDGIGKVASGIGRVVAGAFTVGAITNFVGSVFDAASQIHDMSQRLGVSAEAAQRFKYAAEQTGSSVEAIEKAIGVMNRTLATGDKSTVGALTEAGLRFSDIRQMKPEEAFTTIADAVGKIEDPMARARVAQELFGKGALELLPGMIEGYKKLGSEIDVMSGATIDRLEAAQDSWDKLWSSVVIHSGEMIGALMDTSNKGAGAMGVLVGGYAGTTGAAIAAAEAHRQASAGLKDIKLEAPKATAGLKTLAPEQQKAADAAKRHAEELKKLAGVYTGTALNADLKTMNAALLMADKQGGVTVQQMAKLTVELQRMEREGGTLTTRQKELIEQFRQIDLANRTVTGTTGMLTKSLGDQTKVVLDAVPPWGYWQDEVLKVTGHVSTQIDGLGTNVGKLPAPPEAPWQEWKDGVSGAFDTLALNLGTTIIAMTKGWDEFWAGLKTTATQFMTQIVDALVTQFIDPLIAKLVGAKSPVGKAIAGLFEGWGGEAAAGAGSSAAAASTGASAAGTAAGTSWAAGFLASLTTVGLGIGIYGIVRSIIGYGESPERQTGISQEEYDRRYGTAEQNYNPDYGTGDWTPFAAGGIVTRPTRALIGEAGPEAVIPLGRAGFDTAALEAKLDGLRSDMRVFLPLAVRDALLSARGRA